MGKKLLQAFGISLAATATAILLSLTGLFDRWENATWDLRVRTFARPGPATDRVVLVLIDQGSLDWALKESGFGWPWPRQVYAPILDFCRQGGAATVSFDMLYTEPSTYGADDDAALAGAIARTPGFTGAVMLGEAGQASAWPEALSPPRPLLDGLDAWMRVPLHRGAVRPKATFPVGEIARACANLGSVTADPDPDGVNRRVRLFHVLDGNAVPALSLAAFAASADGVPVARLEKNRLVLAGTEVPLDRAGRAILNYRDPDGRTHAAYSADAVLQSAVRLAEGGEPVLRPEVFRDRHVILAASAPGLMDLRSTPSSPVAPGGEIHATALDNLLSGDFITEAPVFCVHGGTFVFSVMAAFFMSRVRVGWQSALVFVGFLPLPGLVSFWSAESLVWYPMVLPTVGTGLALVGTVIRQYSTEGAQRRFLKTAFSRYLSPDVIEKIIQDPSRLTLGGERRELSIFFSDLKGFSSFSEKLDPTGLTALLNDYLTDMTDILMEEGGTLDKFEGDAIIVFWNAPLDQKDHAARACRAALRCQRKLAERRAEWKERYGVELWMRIGLNTGPVVVGNMGSRSRFNYTILGDAANLASRLEGANKAFLSWIMASEATWLAAGAERNFRGRFMASLQVVGRKAPVRVYEIAGVAGEPAPESWNDVALGIELCLAGKPAEALPLFERHKGADPLAAVYAERCRWTALSGTAWDGVWSLTEK